MKVAVGEPGSSLKNKTGGAARRPVIDKEKCIGCGQCVLHCPDGCVKLKDKKAEVNYDYCKGCGICSKICPVNAIKMESNEVKD